VYPAVHKPVARLTAVEAPSPVEAFFLFLLIFALNLLLHLPAVASGIDFDVTCTTETFMARSLTRMLAAGHDVTADRATAPARCVVGLDTSSCRLLFATETALLGAHGRTRRARAGMTEKVARMRTRLGESSFSTTGLPTRVRRQAADRFRIQFLLTPARIRRWLGILGQIATGTSPLFPNWRLGLVLACWTMYGRTFVLRPSLYTSNVKHGPACPTGPNF
jgi:hypothetical protein